MPQGFRLYNLKLMCRWGQLLCLHQPWSSWGHLGPQMARQVRVTGGLGRRRGSGEMGRGG